MIQLSDLWKLIRRRKRCLTVAPMPLPEAIPVEEAEVAAIFAEFDVLPSTTATEPSTTATEPTTTTTTRPNNQIEGSNVTQQTTTTAHVTTANQHRRTEQPLTVIAEREELPSMSGPSMARVVVIGIR